MATSMSTSSPDLQTQMCEVRQNLGYHSEAMVKQAEAMVEHARAQLDWHNYVAKHPWITLGAAAAAGYLLVPRRHRCAGVDGAALTRTVGEAIRDAHKAIAASPPQAPGVASGLIASLFAMLLHEGLNYGTALVREYINRAELINNASKQEY